MRIDKYTYRIYNGYIMTKAVINFKVEPEVKIQAQKLAKELGVPLSVLINAQLKQLVRTRSFEVNANPVMTPLLENVLAGVEADRLTGKNITRTNSKSEALSHLNRL